MAADLRGVSGGQLDEQRPEAERGRSRASLLCRKQSVGEVGGGGGPLCTTSLLLMISVDSAEVKPEDFASTNLGVLAISAACNAAQTLCNHQRLAHRWF